MLTTVAAKGIIEAIDLYRDAAESCRAKAEAEGNQLKEQLHRFSRDAYDQALDVLHRNLERVEQEARQDTAYLFIPELDEVLEGGHDTTDAVSWQESYENARAQWREAGRAA